MAKSTPRAKAPAAAAAAAPAASTSAAAPSSSSAPAKRRRTSTSAGSASGAPAAAAAAKGPYHDALLAHDGAFSMLLSLLPANLYLGPADDALLDEEAANAESGPGAKFMKNKKKKDKELESARKKEKAREGKRAKLDPANQKSIPELQAERAAIAAARAAAADDDVSFSGSELGGEGSDDDDEADAGWHAGDTDEDMVDSDMETDARPAAAAAPVQDGASSITELRAKLHARIGVLQAKRRAPGITGSNQTPLGARTGVVAGASSAALDDGEADDGESLAGSKDELLEERRRKRGEMRDRRRRERKEARRAAGTPKPDKNAAKLAPGATKGAGATSAPTRAPALLVSDGRHGGAARAGGSGRSDDPSGTDVTFSKLKFAADAHTDKKSRHAMPADPKAALAVLEARKAREAKRAEKLEAKGPDADAEARAKEKKESERWSRAEAAAEGVKLRDDEGLLKKAVKRKEKEKSKSAKEWGDRARDLQKKTEQRIKKRTDNLAARKERTGGKKKGGAAGGGGKKGTKARPGFEGKASFGAGKSRGGGTAGRGGRGGGKTGGRK